MSAYKKLLKNSGIFAIGSLGSKIISILLVPFYTYVLTVDQYGTIDMIMTSISLTLPIITLSIFDATLRFTVKSEYSKKNILTSSVIVLLFGNIIFLLVYPIIKNISIFYENINLFYLILFFQGINSVFSQFSRGIGKIKEFALNGIINTFVTLVLNVILLSKFDMGITGYFISVLTANLVCNIYLMITIRMWTYFDIKSYSYTLVKQMLIYSIPLIPNALMWWIMNASDRYIIALFLGVAANGIYAVAYKIPTILNLLYSIFSQAWQLSAIEEGESKNKSQFYTNVFNVFSLVMLLGTSIILIFIKPVTSIVLGKDFSESWKYVPFLLLAVVFTSFSSFLGANYIALKKTRGIFKTSMIGAITNIVLNFLMIPRMGLNGAAISTMISFIIVWIIRIYETKDFIKINFNIKNLIFTFLIISIQILVLYINIKLNFIIQIILLLLIILVNIKLVSDIMSKIKNALCSYKK